jgi:sec-independent protein translocase protein TatC
MNDEQVQPLTEHLEELRRRIIWVLLFFLVMLIISFYYSIDIFRYIKDHTFHGYHLTVFKPADPIMIYMEISLILALVFTSPVIMYHLWQFVRPGLKKTEQRAALIYIPVVIGLFFLGALFGYFVVFPYVMDFLFSLSEKMGVPMLYGVDDAFNFLFSIVLPLALFFELPVIVLFLTRIRLITPAFLMKMRRVAYFILVVFSALIAPPNLVSNILIFIPLILLYEISVGLSSWLYRRMEKKEEEAAEMDGVY